MLPDARCAANRTPRRAARTATGLAALILCTGLSAAAVGEKAGTVVNAGLPVTTVWSALQNGGGGTASEQPWGIAIGPDGHPAITARTNNGDTIYVAKYNSANGAVLWSQTQVGGALTTPKSIAANAASDIIVVGHLASTTAGSWITRQFAAATGAAGWTQTFATTIFDQPTGVGIGPSNVVGVAGQTGTQTNFHTRGYSAAGSAAFTANEAASAGTRGHSVAFDTAGNAIVAGERNNGTNSDCYVVKYNGSGTKQWEAILTGNSAGTDRCFSVAVDGNNDVLAAGRLFQDNAGTPSADAAVIKLNGATGAEVWRRAINGAGSGTDQAFWIQRASNNDALITGYATNAAANRDIITARIAATTGAVVWQQLFNGTANLSDEGRSLALDSSGNVYVAGQTGTSSTGPNFTDHYTVKYDGGTGTLIWDAQYNGPAGRTDQATPQGAPAIVVSAPDQVYVVIDTQNAAGDQDTLTLKYTAAAPPSPSASIAVAPASVSEDGATNLTYTVTLSSVVPSATTVNITTGGSASSATDYTGGVTTLTIPANTASATITINPNVDGTVEVNETVILTVAPGTGYTVGSPASATGTILNDDVPTATIAVSPASVAEDGAPSLVYTVTLNQANPSAATSVNYTVGGTANNGTDYSAIASPLVIPANATTGIITVNPTADAVIEADETVILTLSAGTGYTVGLPSAATGTILNDDLPNLTINDVTVNEGNAGTTNFSFTVSLSAPAGPGGVTFDIATANGSATAGVDYVANTLTNQTIPASSSTYTFTVLVNGDALNEPSETFFVNVTNVVNAVVIDGQGVGTIVNDDPLPSLSINDMSIAEGDSGTVNAVFTVTLSAASGQTVQVNYATANDTANGADYNTASGTLTFTPGQTTRTITVQVIGDAVVEPDETYFVNLSGATNATISDNQGVGTITNDDTPTLSIGDVSIAEGNSGTQLLSFTVTRNGTTASAVTFDFASADDTATAGSDYVTASGSDSIPAGGASGTTTIDVTINGDAVFENSESFFVNLSNPGGATIGDGQAVGTITNDDSAPTLSINDVSITEGNSGTQNLVFTVTRTGLTALPASFTAATADGTATAPSDYLAALVGSTTIAAGGATGTTTLTATINGDAVVEANETFVVNLSAPTNATIADNQGAGTISNDDTAGVVVTQSGGNTAVTEGGASDSYTVVLTSQPTANVAVVLSGTQVTATPTPLTFTPASWNVVQTVTVTALDDAIAEGNHSGSVASAVTSGDAVYSGFPVSPVPVSITDNDIPGITVTQSGGTTVATEGGATDSYSVVLTSQPTNDVVIALSGTQVTPAPSPLTFTSGNWNIAQTVTVTAIDDAIAEGNHSGSVSSLVSSADSSYNSFVVAPISVSISDNDTAGVTITQTGSTDVTEGGATDTYTAVLTSQPTADVTITPSTTGEVSISPASRIFTAANWNVAQSFTVTATDDAIVEGAESATITHSSASGDANYQGATVASVTAAISDNDSATVQFAPSTLSQTEANSPMAFTVTLSAPVQSGVTLTLNSAPGTATAADFAAIIGGTVTFAPNTSTSQTVNVVINNDALDENDESYTLTLSGLTATGAVTLGAATATGTILDDDPTPTISVTSPSLAEGNAGTSVMNFVVSLNAVSGRDVTFTRATVDGTATVANNDYVALSAATATIPAGQTSLSIPVTINGDTPYEGDESFSLAITGVSNATPASITGTGTIIDDDQQPTTTTITGDTPDPTVVGQAYTVSASVVAQTTSPLGTVTISDGSASCTATLTAGTAPNSAMSCLLTSTSAGAKTLTANYTPASSAFAASSDTDTHQVNAAATTISVSGPARSRINQATSFSFALGVTLPGAGTPTGVVTLTSGAATCTATLPATSCNLTFTTLGARTVTASYASDGNYLSSTSSGAGNAQTLVYALSDLSISKTDGIGYYEPGDLLVYSVIVRNLGPDDAANIRVVDTIPAGLTDVVWSCDASGGGVCPASGGAGNLDVVLANLRVGALLNFTFFGNVAGSPLVIANTASIVLPADTTIDDPSLGNNSTTDTDVIDFSFRDGFESPPVNAPTGSARIPALALARSLGDEAQVVLSLDDGQGEALRVYARLHDNSLQYALARRASNGQLRLEAWRSLPGEPTLSWSARAVATGWVMEAAELR